MASEKLKTTYQSLRTSVNPSDLVDAGGTPLDLDLVDRSLDIMPDDMLEVIIINLQGMLNPTKHAKGGIVSLNQMTQPIGYR